MFMKRMSEITSCSFRSLLALLLDINILFALGKVNRLTTDGVSIYSLKVDWVDLGRFYLGTFISFTGSKKRSFVLLTDAVLGRLRFMLNSAKSAFFFRFTGHFFYSIGSRTRKTD